MLQWFSKKIHNRKGFTLIELVVVIAILGILAAIAVPRFADQTANAQKSACLANQRTIESAIAMYYANNSSTFPANLAALETANLLNAVPTCPTDKTAYTYDKDTGAVTCDTAGHTK